MSIKEEFKDLLLSAIAEKKFNAIDVAHELSRGFDSAMIHIKGRKQIPYEERDAAMDRLVEINDLLEKWEQRDEWEEEIESA